MQPLFGMSISAAELQTCRRASGTEREISAFLRGRLNSALRRSLFVTPFLFRVAVLGDALDSAIFNSAAFTRAETPYKFGEKESCRFNNRVPRNDGRSIRQPFYALTDTRTPLRSLDRVVLTTILVCLRSLSPKRFSSLAFLGNRLASTAQKGLL